MGIKLGLNDITSIKGGSTIINKVMVGATLLWEKIVVAGLDPDYQLVLDYATANTIPLPTAEQQAIDSQFLIDYKATGAWALDDCVAKFSGTADTAFKLIDWKRLISMTPVGALTWDVDGVKSGTGGYIKTGFVPSTDAIQMDTNDIGLLYVDNTNDITITSTNGALFGVQDSNNTVLFGGGTAGHYALVNDYGHGFGDSPFTPKTGVNALYKSGSTIYEKTAHTAQATGATTFTKPVFEFYLFAHNQNNTNTILKFPNATMQFMSIGASKNVIHTTMETVLETI